MHETVMKINTICQFQLIIESFGRVSGKLQAFIISVISSVSLLLT